MKDRLLRVLSFFLVLFIMFLIPLLVFRLSLSNKNYYNDIFENNGAKAEICQDANDSIRLSYINNNISYRKYKFVVDEEVLYDDFTSTINSLLDYLTGNTDSMQFFDTNKYIIQFDSTMASDSCNNNLEISDKDNVVSNIRSDINNAVWNSIDSTGVIKYANSSGLLSNVQKITAILSGDMLLIVIVSMVIIIVILMFCIGKMKLIKYVSLSMIISGIIMSVVSFSGYLTKMYYNSPIGAQWLRKSVGDIIKNTFIDITVYSSVLVVLGIIFLIIYNFVNKRKYNLNAEK